MAVMVMADQVGVVGPHRFRSAVGAAPLSVSDILPHAASFFKAFSARVPGRHGRQTVMGRRCGWMARERPRRPQSRENRALAGPMLPWPALRRACPGGATTEHPEPRRLRRRPPSGLSRRGHDGASRTAPAAQKASVGPAPAEPRLSIQHRARSGSALRRACPGGATTERPAARSRPPSPPSGSPRRGPRLSVQNRPFSASGLRRACPGGATTDRPEPRRLAQKASVGPRCRFR